MNCDNQQRQNITLKHFLYELKTRISAVAEKRINITTFTALVELMSVQGH